ncbi:uncharacterized protein MONBRDRAFT_34020 [Monosiga brevicollis MX1]|uniref:Saccharopine dehydrogenase n=1 Tax=Monosiga brevicollis TaxID=81824 RepID=A9V958_MONBE|nr:uncharacterized protein MONBRDRAFT_34020 [Monosiga brevicollis MX1]EDQ85999.1 predicted protein [Monosiga brevicollis MX1]|eukprot:XP_001749193.1 hypothetical protein [Monosiga brevicollis MX1]
MPQILLLGAGFVAGPCLDYLLRRPENNITVACRTLEKATELVGGRDRCKATSLDVKNADALLEAVSQHDLVISLIPYTYHPLVIEAAIKAQKHFVSTSYVSPTMAGYDQAAKDAGITVMNEIGVDPGIDHLYAKQIIDKVHAEGGKIDHFTSFCGGLPAPEASNNPLGYKFSWSARGVLLAAGNTARWIEDGQVKEVKSPELLTPAAVREVPIYPAFAFEGYPNRDSTPYPERYGIPEAKTVLRGTLRYKGNPAFVKALADVGFLNDDAQPFLQESSPAIAWCAVMARLLECGESEEELEAAFVKKAQLADSADRARIVAGMKWFGLFASEDVPRKSSLLDSLAEHLAIKLKYQPGERDMIMMQHKFHVTRSSGKQEIITSTMLEYGIPHGATAMARTVGIPCGMAVQLVLDGKITKKGVFAPLTPDIYEPLIQQLEAEGICCKEELALI